MDDIQQKLGKLGIEIPEIFLPQKMDLQRWAVVACDQFTQDRAYWEQAREAAAGQPSTLDLIFPEAFLNDDDHAGRIKDIHQAMRNYLAVGVFAAPRRGLVYLERDTPYNRGRRGLVAAVDLEQYDWSPTAWPLIRSTEGTVAERLPPRMDIRRNAPLETPHILLLIDDDEDTLLRELGERAKKNAPAYQGDLMLHSGSVSGWFLDAPDGCMRRTAGSETNTLPKQQPARQGGVADWAFFAERLEKLAHRSLTRYSGGDPQGGRPFLFAVGDGNHSLASAKGIWEEYKQKYENGAALQGDVTSHGDGTSPVHPCRYALVEIENIYDPAIKFEPIHRMVFGLDFDKALKLLSVLPGFSRCMIASREELLRLVAEPVQGNRFGLVSRYTDPGNAASGNRYALMTTSASGIATASLQPLLDRAINDDGDLSIDYIHGEDELFRLASDSAGSLAVGILLPPVQKDGFFETVARCGPLPRKSFSMGEAEEKRFYIECRKLFS